MLLKYQRVNYLFPERGIQRAAETAAKRVQQRHSLLACMLHCRALMHTQDTVVLQAGPPTMGEP